ncbi:hypothetical protein L1987_58034 [Smallanthus sonchifolius]|uniref:Uncharacterized protein n=1 Tax=Smallanthus sonchifolius TaxID=185202 RepID=A0ACB9DEN9_9ASTR|nr:hypothetical protein L1987_58034 [Smallanthus sonchifolius]
MESYKCISDVMKLPDTDLQKIASLGVNRNTEHDSVVNLIKALKMRGFTGFEREEKIENTHVEHIIIMSWEYLNKMEKFLITFQNGQSETLTAERLNDSNDPFGDYVVNLIKKRLEDLTSDDSEMASSTNEEEKSENQENKEEEVESLTQPESSEVPLTHSQAPISEWFYDTGLQRFVIKIIDGTISTFSEIREASVLPTADIKLLSLLPMSVETEKGNELLEKMRLSMWSMQGQEKVDPISLYNPIVSWEDLHGTGTYKVIRADGSKDLLDTSKLLCMDETSLQKIG